MNETKSCGFKRGPLPECVPLALSYTPFQESSMPAYDNGEALMRGTLFPGLDLPFMNIVNTKNVSGTPLGELQALHFVCMELQLYLDTHKDDMEAFEALKGMIAVTEEAHKRYAEKYGPLKPSDLKYEKNYTWVDGPWPWEYKG